MGGCLVVIQVEQSTAVLDATVKRIIDEGVPELLSGAADAAAYNTSYVQQHAKSLVQVGRGLY